MSADNVSLVTTLARIWERETARAREERLSAERRPSETEIADYAFRLATTPRLWVDRRVEAFEFVDADTVRRRMSVDFTLPEQANIPIEHEVAIPLIILRKEELQNFSIRDSSGRALPVLTASQNAEIAAEGLKNYLTGLAGSLQETSQEADEAIASIVGATDATSGKAAMDKALADGGGLHAAVDRLSPTDRKDFSEKLTLFAGSFLLLVTLPYRPGYRQLVKFSQDRPLHAPHSLGVLRRAYLTLNRIFSSFGLLARIERFDDLAAGQGKSYHAELVPPADTYVAETTLTTRDPPAKPQNVTSKDRYRPHVRVVPRSQSETASLTVLLQARRETLIVPLFVSAAIIAGTLWFVEREAALGRLDGATLAALLLVPFLMAAFYVRSAENTYLTEMLRGVRFVAIVPIVAGVFVIAAVGLGYLALDMYGNEVSTFAFTWSERARYFAVGATGLLVLAMLSPAPASAVRPLIRRLQRFAIDKQEIRKTKKNAKEVKKKAEKARKEAEKAKKKAKKKAGKTQKETEQR